MCQQLLIPEQIEEISLFGARFHKVKVCQLLDYVVAAGRQNKKTVVGNVNIRGLNIAYEEPWYRDYLNRSDLVFCDGFGVLLAAKLMGHLVDGSHRMTCPDYIEDLAKKCEREGISLFLLAGQPGVTDIAVRKLKAIAPGLRVAGHHGYFQKTGPENDAVIEKINAFKPDLLYIGFGMPVQERWMVDNLDRIHARVFLPLGACLDFYTDTVYRGPRWLTDNGLEWLTRLVTEPKRLWDRYIIGNPLFFYRVVKYWLAARSQSRVPAKFN
ncbi:WecB/TagA/CpsF family glycosyltransferase [Leptolyngbya sp. AN02str]|uniref:WecB/TagA/CpsF family glycosyltransferase n=1 Tax=Leptolyngbya sp. AN02str TaxID=3423363 RepID=UPI003D31955E